MKNKMNPKIIKAVNYKLTINHEMVVGGKSLKDFVCRANIKELGDSKILAAYDENMIPLKVYDKDPSIALSDGVLLNSTETVIIIPVLHHDKDTVIYLNKK